MSETLLGMAKDLVEAQIKVSKISPEEMHIALKDTFTQLLELAAFGMGAAVENERQPARSWKDSIKKHWVTCLVCGATAKQLTLRHLKPHGMDARSYRIKYGIPLRQPLSALTLTARRKELAYQLRPWETAPMYLKKQQAAKQAAAKKTRRAPNQPPKRESKAKR